MGAPDCIVHPEHRRAQSAALRIARSITPPQRFPGSLSAGERRLLGAAGCRAGSGDEHSARCHRRGDEGAEKNCGPFFLSGHGRRFDNLCTGVYVRGNRMGGVYRRDVQRLALKTTTLPTPMKTAATNLRLTPRERDGIRAAVQKACGKMGAVWRRVVVFGSRTDPNRRGGDIDLLIELEPAKPTDTFRLTQRLRLALEDELGEQRIDLVLDDGNVDSAFPTLARETGVELWSNI